MNLNIKITNIAITDQDSGFYAEVTAFSGTGPDRIRLTARLQFDNDDSTVKYIKRRAMDKFDEQLKGAVTEPETPEPADE